MAIPIPVTAKAIRLVIGLGNPGDQYTQTRHNAGTQLVQAMATQAGATWKLENKLKAQVAKLDGRQRLVQSTTFMNDSGQALQAVMQYYKIPIEAVLVIHDELDFGPGTARLKFAGGHGGHNGLRDIIRTMGAQFWRLRLGIGHPGHKDRVHGYVLQRANANDQQRIDDASAQAAAIMPLCFAGEFQQAMQQLHEEDRNGL